MYNCARGLGQEGPALLSDGAAAQSRQTQSGSRGLERQCSGLRLSPCSVDLTGHSTAPLIFIDSGKSGYNTTTRSFNYIISSNIGAYNLCYSSKQSNSLGLTIKKTVTLKKVLRFGN